MPRDIPIGNGNMLVAFDKNYCLRELYFPYVGQANHTKNDASRFGVWVDGRFSWVDSVDWRRELAYEEDTLVTQVVLVNEDIGLRILCSDAVHFHYNVMVRRILVENLQSGPREVRLFFHQQFQLGGFAECDSAFYHPEQRAYIHYKGNYWVLAGGMTTQTWGIHHYTAAHARRTGMQPAWQDAEDGELSQNPVTQGSIDSVVSLRLRLEQTAAAWYWLATGANEAEVVHLNEIVRNETPDHLIQATGQYWRNWSRSFPLHESLPANLVSLYRRSLLVVRTQTDNRGAILAANDSEAYHYSGDGYSYMWPRDGALVAYALDRAGCHELSNRFLRFCATLPRPDVCFAHKYNPDGTIASSWHTRLSSDGRSQLPIQEDETGLILWALEHHVRVTNNLEFVRPLYIDLVRPCADFLCSYRDGSTGLPLPSWDLWEEQHGIHLFTVAAVWAGLEAASRLARLCGDPESETRYQVTAAAIKAATETHMILPGTTRFANRLKATGGNGSAAPKLDNSQCGPLLLGMFTIDHKNMEATLESLRRRLWCRTYVGGYARYEEDHYYACTDDWDMAPGNPWIICTLWMAHYLIERADSVSDLDPVYDLLEWVSSHAEVSGCLPEQLNPLNGLPLSVSPLTWSHAQYITTLCLLQEKLREWDNR